MFHLVNFQSPGIDPRKRALFILEYNRRQIDRWHISPGAIAHIRMREYSL